MNRWIAPLVGAAVMAWSAQVSAQSGEQVIDLPTRTGVTQRLLVLEPPAPKAVVALFAGGHGGLQIGRFGYITSLGGNFLVRTRAQWVTHGLVTVVVDAPSDRQSPPYLGEYRQREEHAADVSAIIDWARKKYGVPVWLVGTSRGSESAAFVATRRPRPAGPDGVVLTASVVGDKDYAINRLALENIRIPVLLAGHQDDACPHTAYNDMPAVLDQLVNTPRKQLLGFVGGNTRGDPCQAASHHGFSGIEADVVGQISAWILQAPSTPPASSGSPVTPLLAPPAATAAPARP